MVSWEIMDAEGQGRIGCRVAVDKDHGTVRYEGPVPPAAGIWLGLEWDNPSRGKHDGSYNGVRYFHTSHPTGGSFVRVEKADFGCSCVSAIRERYGSHEVALAAEELLDLQRAMKAPCLEMVGFEKVNQQQSCFSSLRVVCLHDCRISHAGEDLMGMCPNTHEADLSANLLTSWAKVAEITSTFRNLQFLCLSDNRLEIPDEPESLQVAFKRLSHIVLGHNNLTWEHVCTCARMWPQIEILQVPFNNITAISLPENALKNLISLDLEGNAISGWEEINKLGSLEKLESLNVCDTGLTNICLPATQNLFKSLQCLMIADNKLDKWEYISELNKLPRLEELRLTHNPILENMSVENIHYKTVARVGSLKVLNRKIIARDERRGAEMEYLKEFGKEWLEVSKNDELQKEFLLRHPRFLLLIKKHGAAEQEELEERSTSLNSSLVRVRLRNEGRVVDKLLPKTMLLRRLVPLAQRLFNTGAVEPVLSYRSIKNPENEIVMDNLSKTLDFYSFEEGDEISVKW